MPSDEEITAIKERAAAELLAIPGVVVVGLGGKETGGEATGVPCIKICVERKLPAGELAPEHVIPPEIDGVPTDVIQTGEFRPLAGPQIPPGGILNGPSADDFRPPALIGGVRIRPADVRADGTLGCFVLAKNDHDKVYALTNYHVVSALGTITVVKDETKVGQPSGEDSSTCCNDIIGKFAEGAQVPPSPKAGYRDRDEALVRLDPGKVWKAAVHEIGDITGPHPLTPAERNTSGYKVRKRGARTHLTGGTVSLDAGQTTGAANLIVIKPNPANPPAGSNQITCFADHGDSGSVLVNDLGQNDPNTGKEIIEVVGLIWGGSTDGYGAAFPIENVFDRFKTIEGIEVELATSANSPGVNKVPGGPAALGKPMAPAALMTPPPHSALAGLRSDLDTTPAGRSLLAFWAEHRGEVTGLVNTNRRVTVVWHRSGAAGVFARLARMLTEPLETVPQEVNCRPVEECLDELHEVLVRFGSPRLGAALEGVRRLLRGLGGLTYAQALAVLAEKEQEPRHA